MAILAREAGADVTTKRASPGQLIFPELMPDSFWVITQGHVIIPDGRRFLVVENYRDGWWLAWRDGIAPPHQGALIRQGTLLREEHFRREADDDD